MITKEQFNDLINSILKLYKEYDRWEDFGINLWELPIGAIMAEITDTAINAAFNEKGVDWVNWWLYEKPALFEGEPDDKAYDEEGKEIPTETVDDLWNIVANYCK